MNLFKRFTNWYTVERGLVIWTLALFLFFGAAPMVFADERSTTFDGGPEFGTVSITLFDTPCEHEDVLKLIPESYHGMFQSATASHSVGDVTANACWSTQISPFGPVAPGRLFIIDATGEFGFLGMEQFDPNKEAPAKPNSF
jgi:hypothetical protein